MIAKVVAVVLNWNGLSDTLLCVDSLLNQTYRNMRVVVIDNGSENREGEALKERYSSVEIVKVLCNEANLGFAQAHNKLLSSVEIGGEVKYLVLLNNDAIADPGWIERLVQCAGEEKADLVASKMLRMSDDAIIDNVGHFALNTGELLPLGVGEKENQFKSRKEVFGPCAGAALYSFKMIKDIGFFDRFFVTGYEDAEYGARACLLGYKCMFEPGAVVRHKGGASLSKVRDYDYAVGLVVNIWYSYLKLASRKTIVMNFPFIILKHIFVVSGALITGRLVIAKVHVAGLRQVFGADFTAIMSSRKQFFDSNSGRVKHLYRFQNGLFKVYWERFIHFVLEGRKTIFE